MKIDNHKPKNKSTDSIKSNNVQTSNQLYLIPIAFIIAILPLITRLIMHESPLSIYPWFTYNNVYADFFLYYKHWIFVSISFILAATILIKGYIDRKSLKYTPIFIPLALYAFLALLSSIVSKYRMYTLTGLFGQFESVFAILGYCLVAYYVYLFVQSEKDIKLLINCLLVGVVILGLLGITQFIGHDFFATNMGLKLITPRIYWNELETISFTFGKNRVYLTQYNPNYVGVYVSLVLPILIVLTIFNKNIKLLPLYLLAIIGMIVSLIGSQSTTGLFAVSVAFVFALIFLWRYIVRYYYVSLPVAILLVVGLIVFNSKYDNYLINQINKLKNFEKTQTSLKDIQTLDDEVVVVYNNNILRTKFYVDDWGNCFFEILDQDDNMIRTTFDTMNGPLTLQDERFPGFIITPKLYDDIYAFTITINGYDWDFTNQTEDGTYYHINRYGRLDKIKTAPSAVFTGYEKYGSGRGYLWSRTIPLLKNKIFLGSGADTFVLEFPQQDYVNQYNYGFAAELITKPHNLYLQIGVQTGVISLIAFVIFYLMYFISSFKLYIKGIFNSYSSKVGFGIFIGTLSYMISGIANDSSITVAPVFWVLIGLGIAINHMVKINMQEENNNM